MAAPPLYHHTPSLKHPLTTRTWTNDDGKRRRKNSKRPVSSRFLFCFFLFSPSKLEGPKKHTHPCGQTFRMTIASQKKERENPCTCVISIKNAIKIDRQIGKLVEKRRRQSKTVPFIYFQGRIVPHDVACRTITAATRKKSLSDVNRQKYTFFCWHRPTTKIGTSQIKNPRPYQNVCFGGSCRVGRK